MNDKFIKYSAFILAILVILAAFPWLRDKINYGNGKQKENVSVNMSGFTQETVDKIVIKKGSDEKTLSFKDDEWLIGSDEADKEKIGHLFKDFSDLKVKNMVSNNENNWDKFETTKEKGYQVTITQNGKDNTFFVGKTGPSAGDFYLRKDGIKNVYLVSGELRNKLIWESEKWKKTTEDKK